MAPPRRSPGGGRIRVLTSDNGCTQDETRFHQDSTTGGARSPGRAPSSGAPSLGRVTVPERAPTSGRHRRRPGRGAPRPPVGLHRPRPRRGLLVRLGGRAAAGPALRITGGVGKLVARAGRVGRPPTPVRRWPTPGRSKELHQDEAAPLRGVRPTARHGGEGKNARVAPRRHRHGRSQSGPSATYNLDLHNPNRPDDLAHRPPAELIAELIDTEHEVLVLRRSGC